MNKSFLKMISVISASALITGAVPVISVNAVDTKSKLIALTFDDGPNTTTTNQVLDVLEEYDAKASFFLIGDNIDDESAVSVKRAYDMGMEIDNHSKTHSNMADMSSEELITEVSYVDDMVYDIIGEKTKFFRPPYIDVSMSMYDAIEQPFICGIDTKDYMADVTAQDRADAIINGAKDGVIVLMHDAAGNSQTVEALKIAIPQLKEQGYEFVTLTELFERQGETPKDYIIYSNVASYPCDDYTLHGKLESKTKYKIPLDPETFDELGDTYAIELDYESESGFPPIIALQKWTGASIWKVVQPFYFNGEKAVFLAEDVISGLESLKLSSTDLDGISITAYTGDIVLSNARLLVKNETAETPETTVSGDINGDGEFNVSDVVVLQKWLLNTPDTSLPNWRAADLCEDGELNVQDLCMIKKELLTTGQTTATPVQITEKDIIELIKRQEELTSEDFEKYIQVEDSEFNAYLTKDARFTLYIGYDKNGKVDSFYISKSNGDDGESINKDNVEEYFSKRLPEIEVIEPDVSLFPTGRFVIIGDNANLYSGPGTDFEIIKEDSSDYFSYEAGYNIGNDGWVYAKNDDDFGWIKVFTNDGKSDNIEFLSYLYDKPVIYLYPEIETDVHVEIELKSGSLATTYPKYLNGWDVTAYPDGSLLNKADGTHHKYLFWDSVGMNTNFDLSKGFCISGENTEAFLKEKLTYMGLTEQEMNEFIVYWLPRMEHNAYNLITFQSESYTDSAELHITPEPDSMCRIFMAYVPLEEEVDVAPQQLEIFERNGFTVVEWGGTEINR